MRRFEGFLLQRLPSCGIVWRQKGLFRRKQALCHSQPAFLCDIFAVKSYRRDQVPVLTAAGDSLEGQIEHSTLGIIVGKTGLVLGNQPELAVEALNDIRCIYDFPNPRWIFIKSAQNFPVVLLAFHAGGVLLPPLFAEPEQMSLRLVQGHGGVDFL